MKTSLLRIGSFFFFASWGMCVLAATKSVTGKVTGGDCRLNCYALRS